MNVLLGSVGDFSLSQSRENLPHGDVPFPQPITEVRLLEVNLVPVKTNSDVSGSLERIANLEDRINQPVEFSYCDDNEWHENMAA